MAVTVDTLQVWRAVKQDHGKALISHVQRESVTMTKQVWHALFCDDDLQCFKHTVLCLEYSVSLHVFVYLLKVMAQMFTTVLKTRRRMAWTVVWTAGNTLRKTVNARAKRRGRARVYATIRWEDELQKY